MGDQRQITFGIQIDVDRGLASVENTLDAIDQMRRSLTEAEESGIRAGRSIADGASVAESSIQDIGSTAGTVSEKIGSMEQGAIKGFQDVEKTAGKAGTTVGKTYDNAEKKGKSFGQKVIGGAKKIQKAIQHPIDTIKDSLPKALKKAGKEIDETGDKSQNTKEDLDKLGDAGTNAGGAIKESINGAIAKVAALKAAFELAKQGIEFIKSAATAIVELGTNAEGTSAKFNALFDDKGIKKWSENFSTAINRNKTEVQGFLVQNKVMYQELGITGKAADELSKITTSLAYDLGSKFKMDDAEALSVMQDYLRGNTAALMEYGIQIDDATLKQTSISMGLGANIDKLDEASAAQVRLNALMENSTSIQRQAAESQEGYANGIKGVKAKIDDLGEKAAARFEPAFTKITDTILKAWPKIEPPLLQLIELLGNGIANNAPALIGFATTALPPLITTLQEVFQAAEPIGTVLAGLATTVIPPLVSSFAPLVGTIANLAQTILPPFGEIIGKIATTVVPPLIEIFKTLNDTVLEPVLMPLLGTLVDAVLPAVKIGLEAISPVLQALSPILELIGTGLGKVVGFLGKIVEYAASGIGTLLEKIGGIFGGKDVGTKADIPHNAGGTNNFGGGWTHINERGGELAYLPSGTQIIPADRSKELIEETAGQSSGGNTITISIQVEVNGNADEKIMASMEEKMKKIAADVAETICKKIGDDGRRKRAIQEGYA